MEKITPRVDLAFKKIFGVEENKDLLISLINSIVGKGDQVEDITLLNPYNPKNLRDDSLSLLDIKAQGKDGKRFNIEIQISDEADHDKRGLYCWAKPYTEQLKGSNDFSLLSKTIGIQILNFTSIPNLNKYHNVFCIEERDLGASCFNDLELHTIELNKFSEKVPTDLLELETRITEPLDMWAAFLTRHDFLNKSTLPEALNTPAIKKALDVLDVMNLNEEEREVYEGRLKCLRVEANALKNVSSKE